MLPTAIVGLAFGLALWWLVDNYSILGFISGSSNAEMQITTGQGIINPLKSSELDLPVSPNNPETTCDGTTCTIDFGEFVISGIPENFAQYVNDNKSSGGTDKLMEMLEQIATHLEDNGDKRGAEEFRDLANLGHYIAELERIVEGTALANSSTGDPVRNFQDDMNVIGMDPLPPEIAHLIPDFNETMQADFKNYIRVGEAKHTQLTDNADFTSRLTSDPSIAFVNVLDGILADPKYSDAMKGVAKTVAQSLEELSYTHDINTELLFKAGSSFEITGRVYDVTTGAIARQTTYNDATHTITDLSGILEPQVSFGTDFESVIMCAGGYRNDTGTSCL
jgi:hypothetical protein